MFKENLNENELAAIELLGLNAEFAVVTRDKNGQYFVLDLEEDDEDEFPRVRMFKPNYSFDGKKERVPKTLVAVIEFDFKQVTMKDGEEATALVVQEDKVLPDAFARDCIYKFLEGFAGKTNNDYVTVGAKPPIDAIIIKGANPEGKKNGFVPYSNLGFNACFSFGTSCAIKHAENFVSRKFNNSFEELYDQFEQKIDVSSSENV